MAHRSGTCPPGPSLVPSGEGPMIWLILSALVLLLSGWLLVVSSTKKRQEKGLGPGETVGLDDVTLFSKRLLLVGRPDHLTREGEFIIPEEWKRTAKRVYPGHRLQLGAYLILVEEEYGVRPPFGVVVIR